VRQRGSFETNLRDHWQFYAKWEEKQAESDLWLSIVSPTACFPREAQPETLEMSSSATDQIKVAVNGGGLVCWMNPCRDDVRQPQHGHPAPPLVMGEADGRDGRRDWQLMQPPKPQTSPDNERTSYGVCSCSNASPSMPMYLRGPHPPFNALEWGPSMGHLAPPSPMEVQTSTWDANCQQ